MAKFHSVFFSSISYIIWLYSNQEKSEIDSAFVALLGINKFGKK